MARLLAAAVVLTTVAVAGMGLQLLARPADAAARQPKALDPSGTYAVTTTTTEGQPVKGTMVIRATAGGYEGDFTSDVLPPTPVIEVTTGVDRLNIVLNAGEFLVQVRMDRQKDGSFAGYWHQLSPGIAATATVKK